MEPTAHTEEQPLQELEHWAVPGYRTCFIIACLIMAGYLAFIMIGSWGPVEKGHHGAEHAAPAHDEPEAPQKDPESH